MIIKRIERSTRSLGEPADWTSEEVAVNSLPIRDVVVDGVPFMVSAWEPTPEELAALQRGETLKLWIAGTGHPVVAISVGDVHV